jgi:hypothetical protein
MMDSCKGDEEEGVPERRGLKVKDKGCGEVIGVRV